MTGDLFKEQPLYDYWKINSQEIFLVPDKEDKRQAFLSVITLMRFINASTFRLMGEQGYLTGLALSDYQDGKTAKEVMNERNGFKTDLYNEMVKQIKRRIQEKEKYEDYT